MRSRVLTLVVISLFVTATMTTPQAQSPNFELKLIFPADILYYDSIAQALEQQLAPLLIQVENDGLPRPVYLSDLSNYNFDLALFSMDLVNEQYPPLWSQFHPDFFTGRDIYQTSNSQLLNNAGITNQEQFFTLLEEYKNSTTIENKRSLAFAIQEDYNDNWLLDIPLISTATIAAVWSEFENFDHEEGIINSIFLGANWQSNPSERVGQDRSTSEFHTAIFGFERIRDPLFYQSRDGLLSVEALYSSAFLTDKTNEIHPNLAISYLTTVDENGSESWQLNIRDDAKWSDGEVLDANDLKFTYDLATFDWIGSTNQNDWNRVKAIELVDNTTIIVKFVDAALTNKFTLADQYILPEHILNQSITVDGIEKHPYEGYNPVESDLWDNFRDNPVTAGPYYHDDGNSRDGQIETFQKNLNYWSPSVTDSPDQIFDLNSNTPSNPYFFANTEEINVDTLVYHISGAQNIDPNTLLTSFVTGSRDFVEFRNLDLESQIFSDNNFNVEAVGNPGGGLVVLFNLNNPHLSQFAVRKAINQAVNRQQIASLIGIGQLEQKGPVSRYYADYYNFGSEIEESFSAARDQFRQLGYDALDDTTAQQDFEWPWERSAPVNMLSVLSTLFLGTLILKIRKKQGETS